MTYADSNNGHLNLTERMLRAIIGKRTTMEIQRMPFFGKNCDSVETGY